MHKCFYHVKDLDGQCSGAIVKKVFPECKLIGLDYGDPFPWEEVGKNDEVIMVDYCLEPFENMIKLHGSCKKLIWIDHHSSQIEAYEQSGKVFSFAYLSSDLAACELVWKYFYTDLNVPKGVIMLGRYDVWDHKDPSVLPYEYGMKALIRGVEDKNWEKVFSDDSFHFDETCRLGGYIMRYLGKLSKWVMRFSFTMEWEGVRFICLNTPVTGSKQFDCVFDSNKHDGYMCFFYDGDHNNWQVHMYTEKKEFDLSKIAVKHGGGGHSNACGFKCDKLPFNLGER